MSNFKVREINGEIFKFDPMTGETYKWVENGLNGIDGLWTKIKKTIKKQAAPLAKTVASGVITAYGGGQLLNQPMVKSILGPKEKTPKSAVTATSPIYQAITPAYQQPPQFAVRQVSESKDTTKMLLIGGAAIGGLILASMVMKKR